jgi:hypothetical protein
MIGLSLERVALVFDVDERAGIVLRFGGVGTGADIDVDFDGDVVGTRVGR